MSVTPDFIGQIFKDTATGNLWRANSTTDGDWTLELQNQNIQIFAPDSKFLEHCRFDSFDGFDGFTGFEYSGTTCIGWGVTSCVTLTYFNCPNLLSIDPTDTSGLGASLGGNSITSVSFPLLQEVGFTFEITATHATSLSLPSLTSVGGTINFGSNTLLQTLSVPQLTALGGDFIASNGALSAASVNGVLAQLVSIPTYGAGKTVALNAGTNAAPSGQGITDRNTLISRGATVNVN